ncbi:MAG: hypothetical protein HQL96_11015 [Magnetococcales bacterium]|nr:hypothetical protein [Magnetococcales bacterium]
MTEPPNMPLEMFVHESGKRLTVALDGTRRLDAGWREETLQTMRGIRGTAELSNLPHISQLSAAMETLLFRMQSMSVTPDEACLEVLNSGLTGLQEMFDDPALGALMPIDGTLSAIAATVERITPPAPILDNLHRYPQAVARAVSQGLNFFLIDLPLSGDAAARRATLSALLNNLLVIGELIDADPPLEADQTVGRHFTADRARLLLATVLQKELLLGLTTLSEERIRDVPIPEDLKTAVLEEAQNDLLEAARLGEAEERMRQEHFERMEQERLAREAEAREMAAQEAEARERAAQEAEAREKAAREEEAREKAARDAREKAAQDAREKAAQDAREKAAREAEAKERAAREEKSRAADKKRHRMMILSGTLAAGIAVALYVLTEPKNPPPLSSVGNKQQTTASAAPTPPTPLPQVAPVTPPPAPVASEPKPPEPKPESPPMASPAPQPEPPPVVAPPAPEPIPEIGNQPEPVRVVVENAPVTSSPLAPFADLLKPMKRLKGTPYERIVPPKGRTTRGDMLFYRTPDGHIIFSIVTLLDHTAIRADDSFTISAHNLAELRLVFQVNPNEAYLFEFNTVGRVVVPTAFWDPFARISQKAVSISRVMKTEQGVFHLRDLAAYKINNILKILEKTK